jgi:adenylate cyclase
MSDQEPQAIKNLSDAFADMFETAEAVKGERFAEMVGLILNTGSLVKVIGMAVHESMKTGEYILADTNNATRKTITRILNQHLSMFADAAGLSDEDVEEANRFAKEMQKKIDEAENAMGGE